MSLQSNATVEFSKRERGTHLTIVSLPQFEHEKLKVIMLEPALTFDKVQETLSDQIAGEVDDGCRVLLPLLLLVWQLHGRYGVENRKPRIKQLSVEISAGPVVVGVSRFPLAIPTGYTIRVTCWYITPIPVATTVL
ncbi:hypothetical protein J6590_051811 [Homalodisca vitripennis]|nr:hypothetical protein J6590_051811 [Homalodisca vitripennis]